MSRSRITVFLAFRLRDGVEHVTSSFVCLSAALYDEVTIVSRARTCPPLDCITPALLHFPDTERGMTLERGGLQLRVPAPPSSLSNPLSRSVTTAVTFSLQSRFAE